MCLNLKLKQEYRNTQTTAVSPCVALFYAKKMKLKGFNFYFTAEKINNLNYFKTKILMNGEESINCQSFN